MSFDIAGTQGNLITIKISGLLMYTELQRGQETMASLIDTLGKVRFLVLVSDFKGFDKAGNWGDNGFQMKYDSFVEKIAIVGDKSWESVALMFTCKGLRPVAIEYFSTLDLPKARTWLSK
jgi:hypothetical protein